VFTLEIRAKIRRHMGYPNITMVQTFFIGNPAAMEANFIIESAMNAVIASAEFLAVEMVEKLDKIANIIFDDSDTLVAGKVGDIEINPKQFEQLLDRYQFFQGELGNIIQAFPNPFDMRFRRMSGGGGINVSVG
jgi:hypothetical protein